MHLIRKHAGKKYSDPFEWVLIALPFSEETGQDLLCNFPSKSYEIVKANRHDKCYKMWARTLFDKNKQVHEPIDDLNLGWRLLLNDIMSDEYRNYLQQYTNSSLLNMRLEIKLWKYDKGCYLSPHTDKKGKIITQLFYFNTGWSPSWGGELHLLRSNNANDPFFSICPDINSSVILIRNDYSWHMVSEQQTPDAICRNVLQVSYWDQYDDN